MGSVDAYFVYFFIKTASTIEFPLQVYRILLVVSVTASKISHYVECHFLLTDTSCYTVSKGNIMHSEGCGSACVLFYGTTAEFA